MKKTLFIFLIIVLINTMYVNAGSFTGTIKGRVTASNKGVPDAKVVLIDENMKTFITSTDKQGYYFFNNLAYGKYLITIRVGGKFYLKYIIRK